MEFKIGVVGTYGCAGFRVELRIHIISNMMRVVVTDRMFSKIVNIRHGVWTKKKNGRAQLLPLLLRLWNQGNVLFIVDALLKVMSTVKFRLFNPYPYPHPSSIASSYWHWQHMS